MTVRGWYLYLYLIMDVWSRRIVGWRIAERESAEVAAALITQSCAEGNVDPRGLVLHSDNGTPMRRGSAGVASMWIWGAPQRRISRTVEAGEHFNHPEER
jgi:putative transposase